MELCHIYCCRNGNDRIRCECDLTLISRKMRRRTSSDLVFEPCIVPAVPTAEKQVFASACRIRSVIRLAINASGSGKRLCFRALNPANSRACAHSLVLTKHILERAPHRNTNFDRDGVSHPSAGVRAALMSVKVKSRPSSISRLRSITSCETAPRAQ